MNLSLKRVYEPTADTDGVRILVDRLWPRGLSKEEDGIDYWAKNVAPSHELRRWYQHDEEKWPEFQNRYLNELKTNKAAVDDLIGKLGKGNATLLYSAKDERRNNAVVLKDYLETLL